MPFVACRVVLGVVNCAERNSKFVAHFDAKASRLGVTDVMSLRGSATTDEARLSRHMSQVVFRAMPLDLAKGELALVNLLS